VGRAGTRISRKRVRCVEMSSGRSETCGPLLCRFDHDDLYDINTQTASVEYVYLDDILR